MTTGHRFSGGVALPGVLYFAEYRRLSIGAKRNLACSRANGGIICHFDDDDWSAPKRMEDQIVRLLETGAPITGYHAMVFIDQAGRKAWKYTGHQGYGIGTSLMYRRELWEKNPFRDYPTRPDGTVSYGEDNAFIAPHLRTLKSADAGGLMFATIHAGNTSKRDLSTADFRPVEWPGWISQ